MTTKAKGSFEVKLAQQTSEHLPTDQGLARMSLDKEFHGDLEATSRGEMLSAGSSVPGSAGYVAIEKVIGTLHGLTGTFVLQHSGTMTRGAPRLEVTVVPDSGTDELAGLSGAMSIDITDGKHLYELEYSIESSAN